MTSPALMPRQVAPPSLLWLLRQPALIVAWNGPYVTLRAGDAEKTIDTRRQPHIINLIRRSA